MRCAAARSWLTVVVVAAASLGGVRAGGGSLEHSIESEVWSERTDRPSIRRGPVMAYDSARHRLVLFGGYSARLGESRLGDTWEWDGDIWRRVSTTGPSPRAGHAMAYDSARGRVVLFGGYDGTYLGD